MVGAFVAAVARAGQAVRTAACRPSCTDTGLTALALVAIQTVVAWRVVGLASTRLWRKDGAVAAGDYTVRGMVKDEKNWMARAPQ